MSDSTIAIRSARACREFTLPGHIDERTRPLRNPYCTQHHGNTRTDVFRYASAISRKSAGSTTSTSLPHFARCQAISISPLSAVRLIRTRLRLPFSQVFRSHKVGADRREPRRVKS